MVMVGLLPSSSDAISMTGVKEVNASMTSEQAQIIRDAVQSGAYGSGTPTEVLR
jgi:hypothetical protein